MADLVDNVTLRAAVAAFAEAPDQARYFEVLRAATQGSLLLDATGSDIQLTEDGSSIAQGSIMRVHEGKGPDGGLALFAFTNQQQAIAMHRNDPENVHTLGQSAIGTLEFAASRYTWLYIDPAGPTCAVKVDDIKFVLRNAHNDFVKEALAGQRDNLSAVLDALARGGSLLYAVAENEDGSVQVRTSTSPTGAPVYLAFTSAAEVIAREPTAAVASIDLSRIVSDALTEPFEGLVINPSGPWIALDRADLLALQARLPDPS